MSSTPSEKFKFQNLDILLYKSLFAKYLLPASIYIYIY